jgi:hypothetical protein
MKQKIKLPYRGLFFFSACAQTRVGYHLPTAWAATR